MGIQDLTALSKQIANDLLSINAVTLRPKEPFTWASGIKSPIYCDNRLTMSYPHIRKAIAQAFVTIIQQQYPQVEVIAGTATAGIPHASWVADLMELPLIYVRDKAKGHGKENQIEGLIPTNKNVVVIEDLISTGGSCLRAAQAINRAGGQVLGVVAIFTYQLAAAEQAFSEAGLPLHTLTNFDVLANTALDIGKIQADDVNLMAAWRKDPSKFGI